MKIQKARKGDSMPKTTKGGRNALAFILAFAVAFLLFGGVMVWMMLDWWKPTAAPQDTTPTTVTVTTPVIKADRRMLLITEDGGEVRGFTVLSFESAMARVRVVPVPRETVVTVGTEETRLFELYRNGDVAAVSGTISSLLGWDIPHYAVITYGNLEQLVTYLNQGLIFTLTETVSYPAPGGGTVTMREGARTLSATQVTALLRYDSWHGGRRARANIHGEIAAALLDQYFVAARFDENDSGFRKFISLTRSNILASDYAEARADLVALARRNHFDISTVLPLTGEFIGVGDAMRFEAAERPLG